MHPALRLSLAPRRPGRLELALVAVFGVWALLEALLENEGGSVWARALVAVGYALPLLWLRRAPLAALLAIAAVTGVHAFTNETADTGAMPFPALLVATFAVGLYVAPPLSLAGAAVPLMLLAALNESPMWAGERSVGDYAIFTFFVVGAWLAGYLIRRRAAQVRAAEAAGGARALAAVAAERARIARELHDVVAHSVSIMALQAGAAEALVERDPAAAREHMASVRRTAHDALAELRRLLDVLREDAPTYAPQPRTRRARRARGRLARGRRPSTSTAGRPRDGAAGVALAAYRVVQEALTNVRKHAGPVPTRVLVRHRPTGSSSRSRTGRRAPAMAHGGGYGLIGMRERVRVYGGRLDAGPDPDGGFAVRASFPLGGRRSVIRVLVADDHALARGGLRGMLDAEDDIEVVGEAADGAEAVEQPRACGRTSS